MEKIKLRFSEILEKIKKIDFGEIDLVVGIARGGIVPGALIANLLQKDFQILWLNFRDDDNIPKYAKPQLLKKINFEFRNKKILVVDDVSRSGATLNQAKAVLKTDAKTFVVNGTADFSLYNYKQCLEWPWN